MSQPWRVVPKGVELAVKLTPKSGRDLVKGAELDSQGQPVLLVRVAAPPIDGAANKAMIKLLAKAFGVSKSSVQLKSGETARNKRLLVSGDVDVLVEKLSQFSAG